MNAPDADALPNRRFTSKDWLFLPALAALTVLTAELQMMGKHWLNSNFLDADEGVSLLVADVLVRGGTLYRDLAYPYGYLPAYLHAAAARVFGNTIGTYMHYFAVIDVVVFALLYAVGRKIFRPWAAFLFVLVVMNAPGALCGGLLSNVAYPLEPIFMLAVVLLWRAPGQQTWQRALLVGLCLGTMQGVKFGTAVVFGAALALVDLLSWYKTGWQAETGRRLWRNNLSVLGGFLLVEAFWIVLAMANLPAHLARDVLWPTYMFNDYNSFPVGLRYPHWENFGYFVGVQCVPCVGAAASLWWLGARGLRRERAVPSAGLPTIFSTGNLADADGILILLFFYLMASVVFFKSIWHFYTFAWILALGGAFLLMQPYRIVRWAALAVWAGNLLLFARASVHHAEPSLVSLKLDNGEQLWVTGERHAQITGLVDHLRASGAVAGGGGRPVVFYPIGGGFHPLFHLPHATRLSWFTVGFIRPDDFPAVSGLARSALWVTRGAKPAGPVSSDPAVWDLASGILGHVLDERARVEVRSHVVFEKAIESAYLIFSQPGPETPPAVTVPGPVEDLAPTKLSP